jgi:LmbE family N-acetylglucosaminyl deacetylase
LIGCPVVVRAPRFERALCVAAHPDDEVVGPGATIASLIDQGCEVHVVVLGEGVGSRYVDEPPKEQIRELAEQLERAASILGAKPHHIGLPDNRFDSMDLLDVVKIVEQHKDEVEPDLVLTHHGGDLNVDHRVTSNAVLTAFRPVPGDRSTTILAFETLSSTEWSMTPNGHPFWPNWFEDASPGLDRKIAAMAAYQHELREWPHPRSLEGVKVAARRWGMTVGLEAAEAFMLLRHT